MKNCPITKYWFVKIAIKYCLCNRILAKKTPEKPFQQTKVDKNTIYMILCHTLAQHVHTRLIQHDLNGLKVSDHTFPILKPNLITNNIEQPKTNTVPFLCCFPKGCSIPIQHLLIRISYLSIFYLYSVLR